jgi:hypothetical protein
MARLRDGLVRGVREALAGDGSARLSVARAAAVKFRSTAQSAMQQALIDVFAPLPRSNRDPPAPPLQTELRSADRIRYEASREFMAGRGIEIGAGPLPQPLPEGCSCDYFDLRTPKQLAELFKTEMRMTVRSVDEISTLYPDGVDFLIAHNVVEHSSNPIGLLARFHSFVRTGGTLVLSLPHFSACPDKHRLVPPIEHLLLDHLLERADATFESREHIYSFLLGWVDDIWMQGASQREYAAFLQSEALRDGHDLHWHSYDT